MPIPDAAYSTLEQIRTKVRRLTRSPSEQLLSTPTLDNYINTFVLYDFPEQLRLFSLRKTLTFWLEPYIDTYQTNTTDPNDPLYNFVNTYTSIHQPIYVAGYEIYFSQCREQFFGVYPKLNMVQSIGATGDGLTVNFVGTLPILNNYPINVPTTPQSGLLQHYVMFDSLDANSNGLTLIDRPASASLGYMYLPDDPQDPTWVNNRGTINYLTGAYNITFPAAPGAGQPINSQTVPYMANRPQGVLYYDNKFIFRPIPDQPYRVDVEAYQRPTLLLAGNMPELSEWWQYISIGASIKVFQDRMDMESVQMIMPEFKQQERLILRRTLMQLSNERTATIYTEQIVGNGGQSNGGWGYY